MADTGLRYALQPIAWGNQVITKGEVRLTADPAVTGTGTAFWAVIDTADVDIPTGKYAWRRIRG
jgi:hypothetical protein